MNICDIAVKVLLVNCNDKLGKEITVLNKPHNLMPVGEHSKVGGDLKEGI